MTLSTLLSEISDLAGQLWRRDYGRATWHNVAAQVRYLLLSRFDY